MDTKLCNGKGYFLFSEWQMLPKILTKELDQLQEEEGFSQLESRIFMLAEVGEYGEKSWEKLFKRQKAEDLKLLALYTCTRYNS